jgi:hypothetical protein
VQFPQRLNVTDQILRRYRRQVDAGFAGQRTAPPTAPLIDKATVRCEITKQADPPGDARL